jgi:sulfite reductase (NADPH) hemoprotein beta-component
VTVDESLALLGPIIKRYALERRAGEEFGDFCVRTVLAEEAAATPASA